MGWLKDGIAAGDMKLENGWVFTTKTGLYGTDYLQRALVTAIGLGANRPQDAVYPTSEGPDMLKKYSGAKKYVMHFEKGQLPPADGFWSLTMYDARVLLRRQPAQPLQRQLAQQVQGEQGRLDRPLHPERIARQGQGSELAAGAEGRVHPDAAAVLAEGEAALDPRRQLEDPGGEGSVLAPGRSPEQPDDGLHVADAAVGGHRERLLERQREDLEEFALVELALRAFPAPSRARARCPRPNSRSRCGSGRGASTRRRGSRFPPAARASRSPGASSPGSILPAGISIKSRRSG